MPLVRVKQKYQVTLPTAVRKEAGLAVGDLLEASVEHGQITLRPKVVVDRRVERRLAEGLEDIRKGRVHGPFSSAEKVVRSLRSGGKRVKRRKAS